MPSKCHPREVAFERLRNQFEYRRQEKASWLAKHVAEVDIEEFTREPAQGQGRNDAVSFELCGALPPTVRHYGRDVASWVAIGHAERLAAKELIEKQKSADKAAIEALANSVRSPRSLETKPSSFGGLDQRFRSLPPETEFSQRSFDEYSPEQSQIQAQSSSATAMHQPCFTGAAAQSWEARITDFYRRWEVRRNEEHCSEVLAEQLEMDEYRQDQARAIKFGNAHVKREEAIRKEAKRLDIRTSHREYKRNLEEEINRQAMERQEHLSKVREDNRNEKDKAGVLKSARETANGFISQGLSLEKTCRRIDLWKGRVQEHTVASERIAEEKVQRSGRSGRLASYRALCEAQKRKVEVEHNRKDKYLMKLAKEKVRHDTDEVRRHVAEEHDKEQYLREKRRQFELIALESQRSGLDACGYERTLGALKDLAEGVKIHGNMMKEALHNTSAQTEVFDEDGDVIPLLDTAPQVRAALGCATSHTSSNYLEELFPNLPEDEEDATEEGTRHLEAEEYANIFDDCPRGRSIPFSETPSTRAATRSPKTPSRPCSRPSRQSPSPLLVRPMIDLWQQASGHVSSVPKKGKREVQSLAALRMIRRTGPLVKR